MLITLLVDGGSAATKVAGLIPIARSVIEALLPLLLAFGIAATGIWIIGTIAETIANSRRAKAQAIRAIVEGGYRKLRAACEPETLNPDRPGNTAWIRAEARDHVNQVIPLLSGDKPEACTTEDESLREWFGVFSKLRMQRGLALLAAEEMQLDPEEGWLQ
ncbi:MAG: hypothetical protein OXI46_03960 [Gemmatimonadota bacterium]|nr:hypothetical protein [Gemmatimonadota bacterium]